MGVPESFYPGSPLGPNPIDDPEYFIQWYEQNCPEPYRVLIEQMKQLGTITRGVNTPEFLKKWIEIDPSLIEDEFQKIHQQQQDDDDLDLSTDEEIDYNQYRQMEENIPQEEQELLAQQEQQNAGNDEDFKIGDGGIGQFFYKQTNIPRMSFDNQLYLNLPQNYQYPEDISAAEQVVYAEQNMTFHSGFNEYEIPPIPERVTKELYQFSGLPSCYTYYYTLPEFVRNSLFVKNVARVYEYKRHDISHKDKILATNYASKLSLPVDGLIYNVARQMIISNKYKMTLKEQQIMKDSDILIFEADMESWYQQVNKDEHTSSKLNERVGVPKRLQENEIEEELCDLPLEYYDNEDGFWNDIIQIKHNRNNNAYPIIQSRPYFKH
ncbi:hypothetical protein IMG5_050700 [Ichthyophthirius multifiliis]|uniref:Uncharacterized protein n=1 Tax=Ichthyophthirius multifiliis TaxID=5932 RepID=G0QMN7_ICHMU|nr:hypothetical protein IMG5_050700 [Ichthyophthirius multifiliis]EGR33518.1 hypothetical protein IMG5_050700 [Ichthyophthirius multifiliis]|eukprot:XP_004037504.1 hypothetical protein IMG5_050700 [Ichthyophthirius multifiliis]